MTKEQRFAIKQALYDNYGTAQNAIKTCERNGTLTPQDANEATDRIYKEYLALDAVVGEIICS